MIPLCIEIRHTSTRVAPVDRIIEAVRKRIVSENSLPCTQEYVGTNETAHFWIVVTALQVVPAGLGIVYIPTVSERVLRTQSARQRAGARELLAPGVVGVFGYGSAIAVNEFDYVPLPVTDIVVIRAIEVDGNNAAACIVAKEQGIVTRDLGDQNGAVVVVVCAYTIDRFLRADAVFVIRVQYCGARLGCGSQALPLPCHGIATVGDRVAAVVVADGFAIVARELICPVLICCIVAVGDGL